ncbi:DUF484 family protein [Pseudoroseicyclus tamaricis]|uniref:DUF484 family protein n=1 Tax=Pseudoroseicyclus tamaricis TaxID=2705421 RepID=A0A6B2JU80_9RHOB|nr:DUF484 family protein [Pseudoroseicyclus tamaricis]NDV01858.1 DUF484 family protein [Pseudoroseicyclus tamaricis]
MSSNPLMEASVRDRLIQEPDLLLDDKEIMRALVAANERLMGGNIVDLRGIAMERLEARLGRLEDTHRSVIAAAYDNLAGMQQMHRAVLVMLESPTFETFLHDLGGEVAEILQIDRVRLVLETAEDDRSGIDRLSSLLRVAEPGFIGHYQTLGRGGAARRVILRQYRPEDGQVYGDAAPYVRSEALIQLDLGHGRLPGMLALGAEDPHHYAPQQGTDLLTFFGSVFERLMRRWLT